MHLKYGQLTLKDVKAACDEVDLAKGKSKLNWAQMSTKDLKEVQRDIGQELKRRRQ